MGIFDFFSQKKKFNDFIKKLEFEQSMLIRKLVMTRLVSIDQVDQVVELNKLNDDEIYGLPEATIVTIEMMYKQKRHLGMSHSDAIRFIESTRSPKCNEPEFYNFPIHEYIQYRVYLELGFFNMKYIKNQWTHMDDFFQESVKEVDEFVLKLFGY